MQRFTCLSLFILLWTLPAVSQLTVNRLRTENLTDPLSLDSKSPRFSWQLQAPGRNELQTAYEVRVISRPGARDPLWTSGKVSSSASVQVAYKGPELQSGRRYFWQVRVWDNKGRTSPWSEEAWWQMGLLHPEDWKARWIRPASGSAGNPLLRTTFTVKRSIASAVVYITAHGLYEADVNGHRIGDAYLTPGWTSYKKRLQYQAYDVSSLIRPGQNAIGALLGNGWYRGTIGFDTQHDVYGKDNSLLLQLIIRYRDGPTDTIATGPDWRASTGEVRSSEIYNGERIDHRLTRKGWTEPGYDATGWTPVETEDFTLGNLIATANEPIRKHEVFHPVRLLTTPKGEQVIDFGQNLVGWVVVTISGRAGDSLCISHAEVLDKEGNFYTENLRSARAEDTFVLSGAANGPETFEPHFTFHGFRYIRISGWKGPIDTADFKAVALYSDMAKTGSFSCSNPLVNQLQH
ncbi:MAG TPA: family 78 glycoside hydrolase catalytic domain, partial [Puia sp.]|nr:family 78 glycoside hydrolase catalytic domain [Puia sp.]